MRRSLVVVVLIAVCTSASFAQYALCRRVGAVVDSAERAYFGLFPNVEGFVSATASKQANGRVEFTVKRTDSTVPPDTTFTMDATVADYLATFIEDFESFRRKPYSVNWHMLNRLADSRHVSDNSIGAGVDAILERRSGEKLHGRVLFVDDSLLVVWQSHSEFSYRDLPILGRRLRISDIEKIIIEQEGEFGTFSGFGSLIGGVAAGVFGVLHTSSLSNSGKARMNFIIPVTLIGAAVGGLIVGAIESSNGSYTVIDNVWIADEFSTPSDRLKKHAVFTSLPPPELVRFVNP